MVIFLTATNMKHQTDTTLTNNNSDWYKGRPYYHLWLYWTITSFQKTFKTEHKQDFIIINNNMSHVQTQHQPYVTRSTRKAKLNYSSSFKGFFVSSNLKSLIFNLLMVSYYMCLNFILTLTSNDLFIALEIIQSWYVTCSLKLILFWFSCLKLECCWDIF